MTRSFYETPLPMRPAFTLVKCLYGSQLFGTSTPESDTDYKSVHLPDGRDILLGRVVEVETNSTGNDKTKNCSTDVDDESIAVHKFLAMLGVGDMCATELLFAPNASLLHRTEEWDDLRSLAPRLLHSDVKGYIGYSRQQAEKYGIKGARLVTLQNAIKVTKGLIDTLPGNTLLSACDTVWRDFVAEHPHASVEAIQQKGDFGDLNYFVVGQKKFPYNTPISRMYMRLLEMQADFGARAKMAAQNHGIDWKAISHAVRVAQQAIELLRTGHLTFPRPEAKFLLAVKTGQIPYSKIGPLLEDLLLEVEAAQASSQLPATPPTDFYDTLTLSYYQRQVRTAPVGG